MRTQTTQADVLGWSLGGMVAMTLALTDPQLVRRAVVAASTPGGVEGSRQAPAKVWEVAGKPVNDDEDFLYLFFPHTEPGRQAGKAHLNRLAERETRSAVKPESVMAQVQALNGINGEDALYAKLGDVQQPVFMANGIDDIMVHAYASYAAAEALPNGLCTIYPASGHGFLFQHHQQFARHVNEFLDGDYERVGG
jgi:pimeloyl-ACP methyl ester carboxylesterase